MLRQSFVDLLPPTTEQKPKFEEIEDTSREPNKRQNRSSPKNDSEINMLSLLNITREPLLRSGRIGIESKMSTQRTRAYRQDQHHI